MSLWRCFSYYLSDQVTICEGQKHPKTEEETHWSKNGWSGTFAVAGLVLQRHRGVAVSNGN